eukprot:6606904-Alexandrium_andersonii.AAC.1
MRPSGASGDKSEAAPGPAQFQVRARGAFLHFAHGELRFEVDCSADGPCAEWGLHFGPPCD